MTVRPLSCPTLISAISATLLLLSLFQLLRLASPTTRFWARPLRPRYSSHTLPPVLPTNRSLLALSVRAFCHTDPGLIIRHHAPLHMSTRNCFGSCAHKDPHRATFLPHALDAPRISSLCLTNPFHGFYDCIWPLIHYLSTCLPPRHPRNLTTLPVILVNNRVLSARRRRSWVVHAQHRFLSHISPPHTLVEKNRIPPPTCLCFRSTVKFARSAFWRPTRFQYARAFGNRTVLASHPTATKRDALRAFRRVVLDSLGLDAAPRRWHGGVLVYGREDARRRRWANAGDFADRLRRALPEHVQVRHAVRIGKTFERQVEEYNAADLVVAPHGAAMANSLFMREGGGVLEIASKHCFEMGGVDGGEAGSVLDMDTVANASDANAWVPWHAQSLGLYHMSAPCFKKEASKGGTAFVTDNESLVELAVVMLMLSRNSGVEDG